MKATLNFDLTDSDDAREHMRCIKSLDMALVLWDIMYELRKRYENIECGEEATTLIENVFGDIRELLSDRFISLDELIC